MNLLKLRCINKQREVYHDKYCLCCFGWRDLLIMNDCNINYESWSELGAYYETPLGN